MADESERLKTLPLLIETRRKEIDALLTDINQPQHLQHDIEAASKQVDFWQKRFDECVERQGNLYGRLDSAKAQLAALLTEKRLLEQSTKIVRVQELQAQINAMRQQMTAEQWAAFISGQSE